MLIQNNCFSFVENKQKMNTSTYKAAEQNLITSGFKMECGMPLYGVRFKSENQYAIILRMGDNNYETTYYDIIGEA